MKGPQNNENFSQHIYLKAIANSENIEQRLQIESRKHLAHYLPPEDDNSDEHDETLYPA